MLFSNHDPLVHRIEYCFYSFIRSSLSEYDMLFIILENTWRASLKQMSHITANGHLWEWTVNAWQSCSTSIYVTLSIFFFFLNGADFITFYMNYSSYCMLLFMLSEICQYCSPYNNSLKKCMCTMYYITILNF